MNQHHFEQKETSMDSTLPYQSHFGYSIAEMGGWSYNSSITPMKQIEGELSVELKAEDNLRQIYSTSKIKELAVRNDEICKISIESVIHILFLE